MTIEFATALAKQAAGLDGKDYVVWRMPKWPKGAIAVDHADFPRPPEAETLVTVRAPRAEQANLF